jgi:Sec-independent protein secretion pathway component TatC
MTLTASGKITYKSLQENRRYFYVAILFICACLTESPYYVSQVMAAIPTIAFFEIIIVLMAQFKIVVFYNFMD